MEQTVLQRPEILAPAGNADMLRAAVFAGADAVYLGLDGYNARRSAGNFDPDALREAVCFCHARGVAVHVTLNTLVYAAELGGLADAVRAVAAAGADAVIVDDLATAQLVRSIAPGLRLHGSTQMSIHTPEGARELAALGYDRVILARELSLEEIRAVCAASSPSVGRSRARVSRSSWPYCFTICPPLRAPGERAPAPGCRPRASNRPAPAL